MNADFFVLRMPLLPLDALERWSDGLTAPAALSASNDQALQSALDADRERARERLRERLMDPQIARAIRLASPDLAVGLGHWSRDPDAGRGRSAERSLVRYLTRMSARPALFGMFAGYAIGQLGTPGPARLNVAGRDELRVRAHLDAGLLGDLQFAAAEKARTSESLLLRRDPGLYETVGQLRVAARRHEGPRLGRRRIIALRPTPALRAVVEAAANPTRAGTLVALANRHQADGSALVARLLESGVLLPAATLPVTGGGASAQAIAALAETPGGEMTAETVRRAVAHLAAGGDSGFEAAERELREGGLATAARRMFHVDSVRPAHARLPALVARELRFAVRLLARVAPAREDPALVRFRSDFERRYGARPVPLLEAVDPDCGVVLHDESAPEPDRPTALLLELLERGRASGEVELSDADLASLESAAPRAPLPDAFALKASLHAAGTAAIDAGEFSVVEPTLSGPSGARMLGRLCDGDPELTSLVGDHLRAEEACRPDALFAELTCVPDTNWGPGMSYRPVLREWEIEYGGCSGAPPDRRLEASDLLLVLVDGELVVHSRRLGRRLLVRTSSAVNPRWLAMPAARLLRLLEEQGCAGDRSWSWGALALAPALPRVRRGRIILSRRRWTLPLDGLPQIDGRCDARAYRAVDRWRRAHGLPGRVDVSGVKGELPVDLGSVQSVEVFLAAMAGVERAHLVEAASADDSPLEGPDGRYAHELIVPWVARGTKPRTRVPRTLDVSIESSSRRFAPGSRWLYAKLYGPASAADAMLREVIAALDRDVGLGRWFFVRYADPDRHLRLRFDAEPNMLCSELLPALHAATQPHLSDGRLHRFALDTYEREVERYGGLGGVELMERAAHVDSVAALELLTDSGGDLSRHLLAVASVGALLADAGLELAERERLCAIARAHLTPPGASLPALLGGSERSQRSAVEHILAQLERGAREDASPAFEVLGRRSAALRPLLEELRRCELHQPLGAVLAAIAHMHINRLLLESGGVAELRVHDALARAYHARSARAK